ncbi:MAG: hypothetical protein ACI4J3_03395 [Oscillospiraceae bacterium]
MKHSGPFGQPDHTRGNMHGYDSDDGTTSWYNSDGSLDSITRTPSDEDDAFARFQEDFDEDDWT